MSRRACSRSTRSAAHHKAANNALGNSCLVACESRWHRGPVTGGSKWRLRWPTIESNPRLPAVLPLEESKLHALTP
eukprot:3376501-Rhodomonas_salina.6